MRKATSVNKGWVVVGFILLVSGLAGFQLTYSHAYAQVLENGTTGNILQDQLQSDEDSLIATPGPSPNDLSPSQQDSSVIGGDGSAPTPNTATSSENTADGQNPTLGSEGLEDSQPGVGGQINQPSIDDNDDRDNSEDTGKESEKGNRESEEENDGGDEEDEEDEDISNDEIPSTLRDFGVELPFP